MTRTISLILDTIYFCKNSPEKSLVIAAISAPLCFQTSRQQLNLRKITRLFFSSPSQTEEDEEMQQEHRPPMTCPAGQNHILLQQLVWLLSQCFFYTRISAPIPPNMAVFFTPHLIFFCLITCFGAPGRMIVCNNYYF